jgi:hypothetical protein
MWPLRHQKQGHRRPEVIVVKFRKRKPQTTYILYACRIHITDQRIKFHENQIINQRVVSRTLWYIQRTKAISEGISTKRLEKTARCKRGGWHSPSAKVVLKDPTQEVSLTHLVREVDVQPSHPGSSPHGRRIGFLL